MSKIVYKFHTEFERDHEDTYSIEKRIGYTFDGVTGIHFYPEEEKQVDAMYYRKGYTIVEDQTKLCSTYLN